MGDNIPRDLPGQYIGELIEAIVHAFRKKEKLGQMLRTRLNKSLHQVAPASSDDMTAVAYVLVDNAEAGGWLHDLILAIYQEEPQNPRIKSFYEKYQQLTFGPRIGNLSDAPPNFSSSPIFSNVTQLSDQGERPHTLQQPSTMPFDSAHLVDRDYTKLSLSPTSHVSPLSSHHNISFSFLYFRRRRHYHSATHEIRRFFPRCALVRDQNAPLLPFLSNCPYSTSLWQ